MDNIKNRVCLLGFIGIILFIVACASSPRKKDSESIPAGPGNVELLLKQLEKNPEDPALYYKLSEVYLTLDSLDYALATIDTALAIDSTLNKAKLLRGDLLLKKTRIKEGYTEYLEILQSEKGYEYVSEIRDKLGQPYPIHQLTSGESNNAFPYYSPDDKRITFQTDRDGNWEIYIMDSDGAQEVRITTNEFQDEMPVFGPKGEIIAFTTTAYDSVNKARLEKKRDICLIKLNESKVARLTNNESDDWYPAISGKGSHIVFTTERDDLRDVAFYDKWSDLYIKEFKSNKLVRLTQNEADDGSPSISSDGKWILFTSNRAGSYQVYKMTINGGMVQQLTFLDGNCGSPHYSRDNKKITFFAEINGVHNIYMMDENGKRLTQMTNDPAQDSYPSFSPDKRKIIFHSNRSGKYQIYWIDLMTPLTQDDLLRELEEKITSIK